MFRGITTRSHPSGRRTGTSSGSRNAAWARASLRSTSGLTKASPADLFQNLSGVRTTPTGEIQVESFYSYDGSLTTPDCSQGLRWSVLVGAGQVSQLAVTRFHRLIARFPYYNGYPNNNRPVQPLNGRIISARNGP